MVSRLRSFTLAVLALSFTPACATTSRPISPRSPVDVLKLGAELPHEDIVGPVRRVIGEQGWTVETEEETRTGGRVSSTMFKLVKTEGDIKINVRLDVFDGMYTIILTGSQGFPRGHDEWVIDLDFAIQDALGISNG